LFKILISFYLIILLHFRIPELVLLFWAEEIKRNYPAEKIASYIIPRFKTVIYPPKGETGEPIVKTTGPKGWLFDALHNYSATLRQHFPKKKRGQSEVAEGTPPEPSGMRFI
jgi:hypothetical protein